MIEGLFTLIIIAFVLLVFVMQLRINKLSVWRIALYDELIHEHKKFHKCIGGLGYTIEGGIRHFNLAEQGDNYNEVP